MTTLAPDLGMNYYLFLHIKKPTESHILGTCMIDGVVYLNASSVPIQDKCDDLCFCNAGEIVCEKKICPEAAKNPGLICEDVYVEGECCPSHNCVEGDEDYDLDTGSQTITTMSPDDYDEDSTTVEPEIPVTSGEGITEAASHVPEITESSEIDEVP